MPLSLGSYLGPYEILAPLGAGGMGEVYRARDTKLGRDVAVKVLPDVVAADPDRIARFEREARVLAALNHHNIAALFGMEQAGGRHFLIMELVEGDTLAERIQQASGLKSQVPGLPPEMAIAIALQIAEAVEAAHEKGIVHRDLKPANVKITPDERVKVLDFGLAKAMETERASANLTNSPTLSMMATQAGIILGTAAYMSPEQAKGLPADHRSDVFAFGVVVYEMLTGRQPFQGETAPDILASVLAREADLHTLPKNLHPRLLDLIRRCLEKTPRRRWQAMGDVRAELETIAANPHVALAPVLQSAAPPRPWWRRALPVMATAVVVSALTAGAMWSLRRSAPAPVTRFAITLPDDQSWSSIGRSMIAMSPDGTHIVYTASRRLYLRSLSDLEVKPITGADNAGNMQQTNPVFSPDGRSIAYYEPGDGTIRRIALSGGSAVTVSQADPPFGMSWDGDAIYFGQDGKGIMRVSVNSGKPELVAGVNSGEVAHGPQLLPGGQTLLFTLATGDGADRWNKARIVAESLTTHERTTVLDGGSDGRYLPTGHLVYAQGGVVFAVPFDVKRMTPSGGPVPIVEGVRRAAVTGSAQFDISDTGLLAYVPGSVTDTRSQLSVGLFDRKGGSALLKIPPGAYRYPRMSPDGKRIALGSDDGNDASIWIYELSGTSAMRRLTFEGQGHNRFPIWSADSQRVAFQSDREGDLGIFWQRADGTGPTERLTKADEGASHIPESWAPDGERFLYNAGKGGTTALWVFSLKDRKAARFDAVESPAIALTSAVFSPDGRWVAYGSQQGRSSSAVYVQPFPPTGEKHQITKSADSGHHPMWSPDGAELSFSPRPGQLEAVRVTTKPSFTFKEATAVPRPFQGAAPPFERPYDISRDGQHFLGLIDAVATQSGAPAPLQIHAVVNWFEELKARVPVP